MKISIITACRNAGKTIEKTIISVINQNNYDNIEFIIIDGASTDNTIEIIEKYKEKIHYFVSENDSGIYNAMNKGIKASSGDYLLFLNADDFLYSDNVVELVLNELNEHKSDLILGDVVYCYPDGNQRRACFEKIDKLFVYEYFICHQSIFIKRSLFDKFGLYDESYKSAADADFLYGLLVDKSITKAYIPSIISQFNFGGMSNNPENQALAIMERDRARNRNFSKLDNLVFSYIIKNRNSLIRRASSAKKSKILYNFLNSINKKLLKLTNYEVCYINRDLQNEI